jgi:hypothetical protein
MAALTWARTSSASTSAALPGRSRRARRRALGVGTNAAIRAIRCYRAGRLLEASLTCDRARTGSQRPGLRPSYLRSPTPSLRDQRGRPLDELDALAFDPSVDTPRRCFLTRSSRARGELSLCRAMGGSPDALATATIGPQLRWGEPIDRPWRERAALAHARRPPNRSRARGRPWSEPVGSAPPSARIRAPGCALVEEGPATSGLAAGPS